MRGKSQRELVSIKKNQTCKYINIECSLKKRPLKTNSQTGQNQYS